MAEELMAFTLVILVVCAILYPYRVYKALEDSEEHTNNKK